LWSHPAYSKKPFKSTNTEAEIAFRGHSRDPEVDLSVEFLAGLSGFALRPVFLTR
jgi:hypothetical protein